jgi:chromosome segregation ATPase
MRGLLRPQRHGQQLQETRIDRLRNELYTIKQELLKLNKKNKDVENELIWERARREEWSKKIRARETELLQIRRLKRERERDLTTEQYKCEQQQKEYIIEVEKLKGQLSYFKSRFLGKNASANVAQCENPKLRQQIAELKEQISRDNFRKKWVQQTDNWYSIFW